MDLSKCRFFAKIDFVSRFWQLPLPETSRGYHAFITHKATFVPPRVIQGRKNGTIHFQQTSEPFFAVLNNRLKAWLDDSYPYTNWRRNTLSLRNILCDISGKKLEFSAKQSQFSATKVTFCFQILTETSFQFDSRNMEALKTPGNEK